MYEFASTVKPDSGTKVPKLVAGKRKGQRPAFVQSWSTYRIIFKPNLRLKATPILSIWARMLWF